MVVDNTSFWRMHDDVPLVVTEVNPDAVDEPQRADRQPELLDDADDGRAGADPARGRDRADRRLHLPVGLGHRPARGRRARRARRARCSHGDGARGRGLSAPDRLQRPAPGRDVQGRRRLHDRGAQDDGRDAQDPRRLARRRSGSRRPACGCRCSSATRESVNVQTREPLSPEECRELLSARARRRWSSTRPARASTRWRPTSPAATRCSSGGSAATPRTSAASTSGSSATTCARARRPTPSRSPSCCAERDLVRVPAGAAALAVVADRARRDRLGGADRRRLARRRPGACSPLCGRREWTWLAGPVGLAAAARRRRRSSPGWGGRGTAIAIVARSR